MEGIHTVSPSTAQQENLWTCQRCGWIYPNAHPSAKHRRNHKKHCGKIKGFEQQSELHKGGSSDEASSDNESLHHQPDSQHNSTAHVEASSKPETSVLHTTSASIPAESKASAAESSQNLDSTDVKPEGSANDHESIIDPCDKAPKTIEDERGCEIKELAGKPINSARAEDLKELEDVGPVPESRVITASDSSRLLPDQGDHVTEREFLLGNAASKHAETIPSVGELSKTNEKEVKVSLPQQVGEPEKDIKSHLADHDQFMEMQKEENVINLSEHSDSHEITGNTSSVNNSFTIQKQEDMEKVPPNMGGTEKDIQTPQVFESDQLKNAQKREIMYPSGHSISREGSSQEDFWACHRCGWVYPNSHPSAKHRRKHKKQCGKLKGFEVHIESKEGGSSDEVSSDEEKNDKSEHTRRDKEFHNPPDGSTTMGATTSLDDQSRDLMATTHDSSVGGRLYESNVKNFGTNGKSVDVDKTYSQSNVEGIEAGYGEGGRLRPVHQNKLLSNGSDEAEMFQVQREIPSNQVAETALEEQSNIFPFLAQSKELSNSEKDTSSAPASITNASDAAHELTGDSRSAVDESSALNSFPSDGFPPGIGSSKSKGNKDGAPLTPFICPVASISAVESMKSSEETGIHQDTHHRESEEVQKPGKQSSLVAENCKSPGDLNPTLGAGNAHEVGERLSDGSVLVSDTILPLESTSGADNCNLENDLESKKKFAYVQAPHLVDVSAKDGISGLSNEGLKNADWSSKGSIGIPQVNMIRVPSVDSMTDVGEPVSESNAIPKDTQGEGKPSGDKPTAFSLVCTGVPAKVPSESNESSLTTSIKDPELNRVDRGQEETCVNKIAESSQMAEMPAQSLDNKKIKESEKSKAEESDESSSLAVIESKSEAVPERGSLVLVGDTLATSSMVNMGNCPGMSKPSKDSESNQFSLEKEPNGDRQTSETVGDSLITCTSGSMAEDSGTTGAFKENDSNYLSSVNKGNEDKIREVSGPPEPLKKPEETDLGLPGQSLNTFSKADSEFSQRSDCAGSSHKPSDSLETYEDAADALDACSLGGSVEENGGLDENHQVAAGAQEDFKPSGFTSLDESSDQKPNVMDRIIDVPKNEVNTMASNNASTEEKSRAIPPGTSYSLSSRMDELRAPSPEAWQEPGPSTLKKEVEKRPTTEVMEDRKSSESHSALRRLMAEEEKDKADATVPVTSVAVDPTGSIAQVSANGKEPKSKSRSFWSHCICCPAVH